MSFSRPTHTRLRYVKSSKVERIEVFINKLPFMVEMKGGLVYDGSKWFCFFILPDDMEEKKALAFKSRDLDKIGNL